MIEKIEISLEGMDMLSSTRSAEIKNVIYKINEIIDEVNKLKSREDKKDGKEKM